MIARLLPSSSTVWRDSRKSLSTPTRERSSGGVVGLTTLIGYIIVLEEFPVGKTFLYIAYGRAGINNPGRQCKALLVDRGASIYAVSFVWKVPKYVKPGHGSVQL